MKKIYILRFSDDLAYLEEFRYETYQERYEYTKDIDIYKIFEESQLDLAYERLYEANR